MNELEVKTQARVMMIHNVDVSDRLTNGTLGEVLGFEKNNKGDITTIFTHFYDEKAGAKARRDITEQLKEKYPNKMPTPVRKAEFEYSLRKETFKTSLGSAKAKIIQFPLTLAFAATGHKFQGQNIRKPMKLVVDMNSLFEKSQAYVMLSRVQEISQLFIIADKIERKWLKPDDKALKELRRLDEVSINKNLPAWYNPNNDSTRILFNNTRSHGKHYLDIKNSRLVNMSDLILISETWHTESANEEDYMLEGYEKPHFVVAGHGKGLATYQKISYEPKFKMIGQVNQQNCQMVLLENFQMFVLSIYRSQEATPSSVITSIKDILDKLDHTNKLFIIGGDFNLCAVTEKNIITETLKSYGFDQIIKEATHEKGRALDHLYIKNMKQPITIEIQSLYWTDHDSITVMVPRQH